MFTLADLQNKGISVVLGSFNRKKFLEMAVNSIRIELKDLPQEIIVVDGGSTDGSMTWLMKQTDIITIVQHNRAQQERRPWGYFMNLAFKAAQGKYICMLSDDCLVIPGAIRNGYNLFEEQLKSGNKIGAVAFYWRNWPSFKDYGFSTFFDKKIYVDHGLYLRSVLEEVNFIDQTSYYFYFGDVDLCMRIREKGYQCIASPESYIEHYEHANVAVRKTNHIKFAQDQATFGRKWAKDVKPETLLPSRIAKNFNDPANTVKQFKAIYRRFRRKRTFLQCIGILQKFVDQIQGK